MFKLRCPDYSEGRNGFDFSVESVFSFFQRKMFYIS